MKGKPDRPDANHASAHRGIRRLEGIIPIAVPVVDQRGAGNEARLRVRDDPIAMFPEGLGRSGSRETLWVAVGHGRGEEREVMARLHVIAERLAGEKQTLPWL